MKFKFKDIFVPTISLVIICLVVAVALSFTNQITKDQIAENDAKTKNESMLSVVPSAKEFEEIETDVLYKGTDENGNVVGYAISTSSSGYGGPINVMTGFDVDGTIISIDVYYNDDETPGLGKNTSNEDFTKQFSGITSSENIVVSKDSDGSSKEVDAVTSATISSRAVVAAVNQASEIFNNSVKGGVQ